MDLSLSLIIALLLDHWLGEPKNHHPLVYFGNVADRIEKNFNNHFSPFKQRLVGLIALLLLIIPFSTLIYLLVQVESVGEILAPSILYFCIAAKSLKQHSMSVLDALHANNIELAKNRVAMIVSRQTENMTVNDVRKATIESVLENGADAIFAPFFWFIIAGPTGAILYRLTNTLDAMWGYKNKQYLYFGWATARFDDILNWIPARLTALSYALLGKTQQALMCWKKQAHLLDSPNAGPVMTAGAGALDIKLGGSAWYHGKLKDKISFGTQKQTQNNDINRTNQLISKVIYLWLVIIIILEYIGTNFA